LGPGNRNPGGLSRTRRDHSRNVTSLRFRFGLAAFLFLTAMQVAVRAAEPVVITVDPSGAPTSGATPKRAVGNAVVTTLPEALSLRRTWRRSDPRRPIAIALAPGPHRLAEPVRFGPEDSGTAADPLVVRGSPDGTSRLVGSIPLQPAPGGIAGDGRHLPTCSRACPPPPARRSAPIGCRCRPVSNPASRSRAPSRNATPG
jgi:hypothetical protein